ncbi:NUDIX hydrolase [Luminiphilus sp. nBUS_16]|uniref:NUDIX hydrolase n=1 Tax=Luminiphilus sp. nBUS_16 TaxID=3395315 RepID=UPI003EBF072B
MKFCPDCGAPTERRIPEDDDRERDICSGCNTIHYHNPKVIVGCIPEHEGQILMCKRAIEPRYGLWTLPAGFMENGETTAEGAARETWEEAAAVATQPTLYRIFDVPHINQVYMFYRCGVEGGRYGVGPESLETELVSPANIRWDELAFPVVRELLREFIEDSHSGDFPVRHSVISLGRG